MFPKAQPVRSKKIRDSARNEDCQLRLPGVCRNRTDTTVWAHSNLLAHGKGKSMKADDRYGCYACFDCHAVLDGNTRMPDHLTRAIVLECFMEGMDRSRKALHEKGLLDAVS